MTKKEKEQMGEAQNQQRDMFTQMIKQQQDQQKQMQDMEPLLTTATEKLKH